MKTKAILFIYGSGGHQAQMKRFLEIFTYDDKSFKIISISEKDTNLDLFHETIKIYAARDKYHRYKNLFTIPLFIISSIYATAKYLYKYNCNVLISTGPGVTIIPAIIFRMLNKKVIFIETWSRFETVSITGRIMYKVANIFYVQNKTLLKYYTTAIYAGRL